MTTGREPCWGWPGWSLIGHALLLGTVLTLWWGVIYGGADWITAQRSLRVRIHFDAELAIPFVPVMVLAYLSIDGVFLLAPFILRTRRELHALSVTLAVVILVAGIGFVLIPAQPAYASPTDPGVWAPLCALAKTVALQHNMVPSLHVAMSCVCVSAYATRAECVGKVLLGTWAAVIAVSTLLIHQHHVIDVLAGFFLAWAGKRFIYDRWLTPAQAANGQTLPPSPSTDQGPPA